MQIRWMWGSDMVAHNDCEWDHAMGKDSRYFKFFEVSLIGKLQFCAAHISILSSQLPPPPPPPPKNQKKNHAK